MRKSDEAWPLGAQLKNPVTIKSMPDWARNGDVVARRGKKYFIVSLHESETRWKQTVRTFCQRLSGLLSREKVG